MQESLFKNRENRISRVGIIQLTIAVVSTDIPAFPFIMNQRTQLSELMVELRGSKNQSDFQRELEILAGLEEGHLGAKYVSLVETGMRKRLSDDFLRAMALKSGRPQTEIEAMNRRSSLRQERPAVRTVSIASGHTAYAAGLIGACLKGTTMVELATCCERRDNGGSTTQPNSENARWIRYREGGIPPLKDEQFLAEVADERRTLYFSANDALDALDGGWADLAAIPSALVEGRRSYQRLLRLVASDAACMLLANERLAKALLPEATKTHNSGEVSRVAAGWEKGQEIPVFDLTTRDLGRRISELLRRSAAGNGGSEAQYKIGAETRTIAEVVLEEAVDFAISDTQSKTLYASQILVPISSHKAATFRGRSLDLLRQREKSSSEEELDGLLMWEPHASWVAEALKESGAKPYALISLSRSADEVTHRPRRFEFDLVTTSAQSTEPEMLRAVRDLLNRVWDVSEELALFKPSLYHSLVNPLSTYFRLGDSGDPATTKRSARVLGSVAYDVGIKVEALPLFDSIKA